MLRQLIVFALICAVCQARKTSTEEQEDFEFVEDVKDAKDTKEGSLMWLFDPNNELCNLLRCGKDEICLLRDRFTAFCVNKKEAEKYGDSIMKVKSRTVPKIAEGKFDGFVEEDDDEDDEYLLEDDEDYDDFEDATEDEVINEPPKLIRQPFARKKCPSCPIVKPVFLCGSDNKTYSSLCRLNLHNCLHEANVRTSCKGFCPCRDSATHQAKKTKQKQRMNAYIKKLAATSDSNETADKQSQRSNENNWKKTHKTKATKRTGRFSKHSSKYNKAVYKNDQYWEKQTKYSHKNDVNYERNSVWGPNECTLEAMEAMGNRMLDWFSVIMSDSRRRNIHMTGPNWCKKEVSWMMGHLDQDNDMTLSSKELYRLEHDDRERCIKPFLDRCDLNRDSLLSAREWCKCFDKSQRPCAALRKASSGLLGGYIPECDSEGYYRPTQCHVSAAMCWCVDKHGVEIPGSRTREAPHCEGVVNPKATRIEDDEESEDERYDGSGDSLDI